MTKAYRAEAREHLKNCVGARFSVEALVIALAGGRIGQSDWSVECDRIISLLDDDADYRRGFEDGLKANTRAAFAAAKQAIPERTCYADELTHQRCRYSVNRGWQERTCRWEYPKGVNGWVGYTVCSSCGEKYDETVTDTAHYCPNCGARVIGADE